MILIFFSFPIYSKLKKIKNIKKKIPLKINRYNIIVGRNSPHNKKKRGKNGTRKQSGRKTKRGKADDPSGQDRTS